MPRYTYRCLNPHCRNSRDDVEVEVAKSITKASDPESCPLCNNPMRKLPPRGTLMNLKGGGWYKGGIQ